MNARQAMSGASRYVDVPRMPLHTRCAAPRATPAPEAATARDDARTAETRVTKRFAVEWRTAGIGAC